MAKTRLEQYEHYCATINSEISYEEWQECVEAIPIEDIEPCPY